MTEKTIKQLIDIWEQEKEEYRTAEIGSGVQKFVKKIFTCPELFNLAEGKLSTKDIERKNEFIEEGRKKGRRADVVIFIDSDVIIPVEIERHGNINAGEKQIFQYQTDWVKKYGLLTDGNKWIFYNNRYPEKTFIINDILKDPTDFLTYWKEYTIPDYYYRSFFEKKGQLELFETPPPKLDDCREDFFIDITTLIENFENKINLKGYFKKEKNESDRKKKAVEITYAYLIQFILYKVLVDNAFSDFEEDWKQRIKTINKAICAEVYNGVLISIQGISKKISDNIYKNFSNEQESINEKLIEILKQPRQEIGEVSVWLDILLFINRYDFANAQNEIFGYVYENYLKDLYLDEKKGQYFTDPHVVDFMLNEIGYVKDKLQKRFQKNKDSISIIDPSCGSGTFLYNATNRIVDSFFDKSKKSSKLTEQLINKNIFGLDIAEFPLYLAEMNILMRMLPIIINERYNNPIDQKIKVFKTVDSIAEFLDTAIKNTLSDINVSIKKSHDQLSLFHNELYLGYDSFMRDKHDLEDLKSSLENKNEKPRTRFDYVIGNPPYISFKECSKQNIKFFELQIKKEIQMSDIYGVNLNTVPGRIKAYAPNPNIYAYFIALGLALLKDEGKICYIIPQNVLTTADLDVIRYHLSTFVTIEKIFNFSCNMFIDRGIKQKKIIPTSSLIFVVSKLEPKDNHSVEVINYLSPNDDVIDCLNNIRKSKNILKKNILQSDLRKNIDNWNYIKFDSETDNLFNDYYKNDLFDIYRLDKYSIPKFNSMFYFDRGLKFPKEKILNDTSDDKYYQLTDTKQDNYTIKTIQQFIEAKELVFPKGAQGLKVYDAKYKIIWRYMNTDKFHFSEKNVMINYNWVLISSNNKNEMLYILSLLNSNVNTFILNKLFSNENEKSFQIGIKSIKEFCRVPVISSLNEHIKTEIISSAIELIEMENTIFSDLVNFHGVLLQKFEKLEVIGNYLLISYKDKEIKCKIKANVDYVENFIAHLKIENLFNEDGYGSVSELKSFLAFDIKYQLQLKNYIDDLIFALYFNVELFNLGFDKAIQIKKACAKHKYYKLINSK